MIESNKYSVFKIEKICKKCKSNLNNGYGVSVEGQIYCEKCLNGEKCFNGENCNEKCKILKEKNKILLNFLKQKLLCCGKIYEEDCKESPLIVCFSCIKNDSKNYLFCSACHFLHLSNHDEFNYGNFELERRTFNKDIVENITSLDDEEKDVEENIKNVKEQIEKLNNKKKEQEINKYYNDLEIFYTQKFNQEKEKISETKTVHLNEIQKNLNTNSNKIEKFENLYTKLDSYIAILNNNCYYTSNLTDYLKFIKILKSEFNSELDNIDDINIQKYEILFETEKIKSSLKISEYKNKINIK